MATLTKLETKLAEVLGLAMAAQDAAREVRGMLGSEHDALARKLTQAGADAALTALPVQQRHVQEALDGSLKLAAAEDPDEAA